MSALQRSSLVSLVLLLVFALSQLNQVESCRNRTELARVRIQQMLNLYPDLQREIFGQNNANPTHLNGNINNLNNNNNAPNNVNPISPINVIPNNVNN